MFRGRKTEDLQRDGVSGMKAKKNQKKLCRKNSPFDPQFSFPSLHEVSFQQRLSRESQDRQAAWLETRDQQAPKSRHTRAVFPTRPPVGPVHA